MKSTQKKCPLNVHLYTNHVEQARLQLTREPYPLPQLKIGRKTDSIFDYKLEDFQIINYQSHPSIKAPIAV
jgi:thymidylate synthase